MLFDSEIQSSKSTAFVAARLSKYPYRMEYFSNRLLRYSFILLCVITLFCMAGYWFWKFAIDDRDIGIVDYVQFREEMDIDLPSVTFCVQDPFLKDQMEYLKPEINRSTYLQYLRGDVINQRLENVEYENITLNLEKYLIRGLVRQRDETTYRNGTFRHTENFDGYISNSIGITRMSKCFEITLNMPDLRNVGEVSLAYDLKRFLSDTGWNLALFARYHYPGQYFLTLEGNFFEMNVISNGTKLFSIAVSDGIN